MSSYQKMEDIQFSPIDLIGVADSSSLSAGFVRTF